ncbi:aromatic-ring-hydroxylating dioxygenase subunit beta [Streptomyces sp. NPDC096132]|uniref:aromatic-ring-hydroxylating dioxygenase subunit beta n=1 Tax=Streptomyces sp. NPDC096132 TaxID=3366075 RepID=UPI003828F99A
MATSKSDLVLDPGSVGTPDGVVDDPALYRRVTACLYREAWLLDDARFEEWLEWMSPDIRYWMPTRFVRKATERDLEFATLERGVSFLDEDYEALAMRVSKTRHRMSWTDNPAGRTVHSVSNIEIASVVDGRAVVRSVASVERSRFANESDRWVFRREDTINIGEDPWKLEERKIFYPSPVLESSNLAIFF